MCPLAEVAVAPRELLCEMVNQDQGPLPHLLLEFTLQNTTLARALSSPSSLLLSSALLLLQLALPLSRSLVQRLSQAQARLFYRCRLREQMAYLLILRPA